MEPRFTVLTLGVDDIEKSFKFYREGMGLSSNGIIGQEYEHGEAAFFDLKHGMKLALYARTNLALDSKTKKTERSSSEFSIGYMTHSKEEVDIIMEQAKRAGATITKPAQKAFWGGYSGYFQDPDGHLWEILYNPQMLPED
ncbi:MAG: VOC family protein [Bacteroidetes bacterium]|nr:VOC family protein [Bacteroidota bacterium]